MRKAAIILPAYADHAHEIEVMAELGFQTHLVDWVGDETRLIEGLDGAEIVFIRDSRLSAAVIETLDQCRGIIRYGVGVDTIDVEAATRKGIIVARVPDYGAEVEVADHALALFLAVKRRIVTRDAGVRRGRWQVGQSEPILRIAGTTAGFVGFGRIARAVAERLRAFGIKQFRVYDPFLDPASLPSDTDIATLEEIAGQCDLVSLHAPATPENHHLINAAFLQAMKPDAILINTARGPLVDEKALFQALKKGLIFGAGIDVFEAEPPTDSPLFHLDNIVVSDHTAWYSETTVANIQKGAAEEAAEIVRTGNARNAVNSICD